MVADGNAEMKRYDMEHFVIRETASVLQIVLIMGLRFVVNGRRDRASGKINATVLLVFLSGFRFVPAGE